METDYLMEKALARLDPDLHGRYRSCVVVSQRMLSRYEGIFPDFTDHTMLHTLKTIEDCNRFIGRYAGRLTADDLYVLLMGAVFHDVGMGVSGRDFEEFLPLVCPGAAPPRTLEERQQVVRGRHHEFSGCYVRKYWQLFDIPNERYAQAIIQVCRGHRKVDLWDEAEYPAPFAVEQGRVVQLPYLAALLRLADEMNIAADRNFSFLYDPEHMPRAIDRFEFKKHRSIQSVTILADRVTVAAATDDPDIAAGIQKTVDKLRETLLYCRDVVARRTDYTIDQADVELTLTVAEA